MSVLAGVRGWMVVALLCATPALAHAQAQQYGQPPNTYVTWGGPSNATTIDVTYFIGTGFVGNQANGDQASLINNSQYDPSVSNKFQVPNLAYKLFTETVGTPRIATTYWYEFASPTIAPVGLSLM